MDYVPDPNEWNAATAEFLRKSESPKSFLKL